MANKFRLSLTIFFGVLTFLFFSGLLPNYLSVNAQGIVDDSEIIIAQHQGCINIDLDLSTCRVGTPRDQLVIVVNKERTAWRCCDRNAYEERICGYHSITP